MGRRFLLGVAASALLLPACAGVAAGVPAEPEVAPRPIAAPAPARSEDRAPVALAVVVDLSRGADLVENALGFLRRELGPNDELGIFAPGMHGPRTLKPLALGDFDPRKLSYESRSFWDLAASLNRAAEALAGSRYSARRLLVLLTDGRHPMLASLGARLDALADAGEVWVSVVVVRPPRHEREGPEPTLGALLALSRGFAGHDTHGLVALTNALVEDLAALRTKALPGGDGASAAP